MILIYAQFSTLKDLIVTKFTKDLSFGSIRAKLYQSQPLLVITTENVSVLKYLAKKRYNLIKKGRILILPNETTQTKIY